MTDEDRVRRLEQELRLEHMARVRAEDRVQALERRRRDAIGFVCCLLLIAFLALFVWDRSEWP